MCFEYLQCKIVMCLVLHQSSQVHLGAFESYLITPVTTREVVGFSVSKLNMVGAPCDGGASQYLEITRDHQMNTQVFATGVAFFILHAQVEKLR